MCQNCSVHLGIWTRKDKGSLCWSNWHNVKKLVNETRPFEGSPCTTYIASFPSIKTFTLSSSLRKQESKSTDLDEIGPVPSYSEGEESSVVQAR